MTKQNNLPAGDFASWLSRIRSAQTGGLGIDVPCGECFACCTSSYFIHIRPEEKETIAAIPNELLFPAPGLPNGHALMGYDKQGRCPMLTDGKCSIYANRPLTCRNYDCRVFAAAGIAAGDDDKILINTQAQRWQFGYPVNQDREEHEALRKAVKFLHEHRDKFPENVVPKNPSQLALFAIKVYKVFLAAKASTETVNESPDYIAQAIMAADKK